MRDSNWARWGATLAAGALALTIVAPVAAQDGTVTKIGYVSPEAASDYGWNEQGAAGAQAAADSVGAELIMADNSGYGDVEPILNSLADDGANFIVAQATGYNTTAPIFAAGQRYPGARRRQS